MLKIEQYKRKKRLLCKRNFHDLFPHFEIVFKGIIANVELRKLKPERTH